jgi:hypothetical protein
MAIAAADKDFADHWKRRGHQLLSLLLEDWSRGHGSSGTRAGAPPNATSELAAR